jgi:hypothetical protein
MLMNADSTLISAAFLLNLSPSMFISAHPEDQRPIKTQAVR